MGINPVLFIKTNDNTSIGIRARRSDDYSEHEIILNSVLLYYKSNNQNIVLKFIELLESVIKRTINELMPHKNLLLEYEVKSDDILSEASKIEINILKVAADGITFKLDVQPIILDGFKDKKSDGSFCEVFKKNIKTPSIVLEKYKKKGMFNG